MRELLISTILSTFALVVSSGAKAWKRALKPSRRSAAHQRAADHAAVACDEVFGVVLQSVFTTEWRKRVGAESRIGSRKFSGLRTLG